jgi:hypothetical protein
MNAPSPNPTLATWLKEAGDLGGVPPMELRDFLFSLDWALDTESQLTAIRGLLARMQQTDKELTEEIRKIEEHARRAGGIENEHAVDEWIDRLHHSVYQDAAHSMAAVGMLAPFIESLFCQGFQAIRRHYYPASPPNSSHERWKAAGDAPWDCHLVVNGTRSRVNLVKGIMQLADATDLSKRLPSDLEKALTALFTYRNKMFHNGFEWPLAERLRFDRAMEEAGWPENWFTKSTSGNEPWIFYMSKDFIAHCLATIDKVLDAFGEFVREELKKRQS